MRNKFEHSGLMIDNSRNAVMNVDTVKKMVDILERLGCNMLMLYTEDTYEIDNHPYFGYLRGRYSKAELKEMDAYARAHGVELMPCIQTLAHLDAIMRWPRYEALQDCEATLCAGEERVYRLIDNMFATLSECFTSRFVNVGMDEAEMIGLGRYLQKHGYQERLLILQRHLHCVSDIARKYGFTVGIWSDMFYKLTTGGFYGENHSKSISEETAQEIRQMIPDNVQLIYWDYSFRDQPHYDEHMECHLRISDKVWFAGGFHCWAGFAPHNVFAMQTTKPAMDSCNKYNVKDVFFTMWGDNGAECSRFSILTTLYYSICLIQGITDEAEMKRGFEKMFGISFDDFMLLDLPGTPNADDGVINADKYILYNDPFVGIYDITIPESAGKDYAACAERLECQCTHPEWGYLFRTLKELCKVLELKANLGQRTRKAYQTDDKEELGRLIPIYYECIDRLQVFYEAFENQWMTENKPYGFEVQDIRIGGLIQRMKHCAQRLQEYVQDDTSEIVELKEHILDPFGGGEVYVPEPFGVSSWSKICSVNII